MILGKEVGLIIALYIILGIVLLISAILAMRVGINILHEDDLRIYLKILFVRIQLYPEKKGSARRNKKQKKDKKSAEVTLKPIDKAKTKPTILDKVNLVKDVLTVLFQAFPKHLHVKLAKLHISVATGDAAQTAILYGAVSGVVACIVELIDSFTKMDKLKRKAISVEPNFLGENSEARINISLYITVFGGVVTLAKMLIKYIKTKIANK